MSLETLKTTEQSIEERPWGDGVIREYLARHRFIDKKLEVPKELEEVSELEYITKEGVHFRITSILPKGITLAKTREIHSPYFNPITSRIIYGNLIEAPQLPRQKISGELQEIPSKYVDFFELPEAFLILLHEVGHAVNRESFAKTVLKIFRNIIADTTNIGKTTLELGVIQGERDASAYALKKIKELRKRGVDLAPKLDTRKKFLSMILAALYRHELISLSNDPEFKNLLIRQGWRQPYRNSRTPSRNFFEDPRIYDARAKDDEVWKILQRINIRPKRIKHT